MVAEPGEQGAESRRGAGGCAGDVLLQQVDDDAEEAALADRVLVVDHNDSFTLNLVHMLRELGVDPTVVNAFAPGGVDTSSFGCVVLSPGPGDPHNDGDVGLSRSLVAGADATLPILGVCLGHQLLLQVRGGDVRRARFPMHGQKSKVTLEPAGEGDVLFRGMPREFEVVRYHSLCVGEGSLPSCLAPLAYAVEADGSRTLMSARHRDLPQWGVQYHPESVCTEHGLRLLRNFIDASRGIALGRRPARGLRSLRAPTSAPPAATDNPPQKRHRREPLEFTCRRLPQAEIGDAGLFEVLRRLARPRVLLDSSRVIPGFSRYSFVAGAPVLGPRSFTVAYFRRDGVARCHGPGAPFVERAVPAPADFFDVLAELLPRDQPAQSGAGAEAPFDFAGGLVGYLGYELRLGAAHDCGALGRDAAAGGNSCAIKAQDEEVPDACFLFVDRFLAYDHLMRDTYACSMETRGVDGAPWALSPEAERLAAGGAMEEASAPAQPLQTEIQFSMAHSHEEYLDCVERCKELIRAGESYELCLTTRLTAKADVDAISLFGHLRELNPAPYGLMCDFPGFDSSDDSGGFALLSSSPERFLRVDRAGVASCKPMKGTARRNLHDPALDEEEKRRLAGSAKDQAENLMIVDLVRHDLSTVCEPASVRCPQLMEVETFASVHQMVSLVRGQLPPCAAGAAGARLARAVRACFPAGSMTGAPKIRSMELLHELEKGLPRGVFSGACGYLSVCGAADLAVVIRSAVLSHGRSPRITVGAGGAVTLLSSLEEEFDEMLLKAERVLQAVARLGPTSLLDLRGVSIAIAPPLLEPARPPRPTLLETMLWRPEEPQAPYLWQLHYERLARSAAAFRIPLPSGGKLLQLCADAVGSAGSARRVRLLVAADGGPRAESTPVEVGERFPLDELSAPRQVCLDLQPGAVSADPLLAHKTLWRGAYDEARRRVLNGGGDIFDVVMYNERREVTETSIANIALEEPGGGSWRTPPLECGLLPGVMRAKMLEAGAVYEGVVTVDEFVAAAKCGRRILCFNSVRGAYTAQLVTELGVGLRPPSGLGR